MQKTCPNFNNILKLLAISSLIAICFFVFISTSKAATGINRQINFQGKLVNANGTNVTNGNYTIVFSLYGFDSGAQLAAWTESQSVTVTDGIFQASLGSVTPIPANFNFNWDGLYLGIKVGSDNEMTPRIRMSAVPFAFNAEKVAGLTVQDESGNASTSGTLKIPNGKTIGFAGATSFGAGTTGLVTLGSNTDALALTTSGATSVALPTGGTLLTNTATAIQTITSTQTSGTILGITDSTALAGAIKGLVITLSGANAQDQTGLEFNLSSATGTNLNDIVGTGGSWKVSKAGALTVASCTGCGGGGVNNWGIVNGLLFNGNLSTDFAIGGNSTISAKFWVNGTTGDASMSGILTTSTIRPATGALNLQYKNGLNSWANALTILDNSGNVGIGTTNPQYGLDVETGSIKINNNITGVGQSGTIYLGDGSFTKAWGGAWTFDGGLTNNSGPLNTNYNNSGSALVVVQSGSGPAGTFMGGNIGIGTTSPAGLLDINGKLTVLSGGNVGIGATSPLAALDLTGSASVSANLFMDGTYELIHTFNILNNGRLDFQTSNGGDSVLSPQMTIAQSGYIGIGTTTPFEKLGITGNATISGTLAVDIIKPETGALNLQYKSGLNAWSNALTVLDNSGNIGIGTTSPVSLLEVAGNAKATTFNKVTITQPATGSTLTIADGLTLSVSTASKTLTGAGTQISIANNLDFGAGTTGTITLGTGTNTLSMATTNNTAITLPTTGTLLTNTATAIQTITSTQTSGTILGITDSTALAGAIKGLVITLSGANAQDQTGLEFNLSSATGTNLNDIVGTGGSWKVSKAGALTVASCTGCGGGGVNNWGIVNGLLFNGNLSTDFAVGGNSTASAGFSVLNLGNGGIPTASISGLLTLGSVGGTTRTIGAAAMNNLQLGDTNTGGITFFSASNRLTPTGALVLAGDVKATTFNKVTITQPATGSTLTITDGKTLAIGNSLTLNGTDTTTFTFPTTTNGTVLTNNAPTQGITSAQTSGTVLAIADSTAIVGAIVGQSITLSGTGASDQTGLQFNLSNASGTNLNDIVGTGSSWKVSKAGALTVASCSGCGSVGSTNNWGIVNGLLFNGNLSTDFAIGGSSSLSAKFLVSASGNAATASISAKTSFAGMVIDQSGSGDILTGSAAGAIRFTFAQNGALTLGGSRANDGGFKLDVIGSARIGNNATTDDIVKQTTADFTQGTRCTGTDYCVSLTTNNIAKIDTSNNKLSLVTDLITAGDTPANPGAGPVIGQNIIASSSAVQRPDRKFVIFNGAGTRIYDPNLNTIGGGANFTTGTFGAGGQAFQRPDGNFVVLMGGYTNNVQIYSPGAYTTEQGSFAAAPVVGSGNIGPGSLVMRRTNGKFIIINGGGSRATAVYDPTSNIFSATNSAQTTASVGPGSFQLQRPDGKWIIGLGGGTSTNLYDPSDTTSGGPGGGGTFSAGPTLNNPTGAGAHVIQLPDGRFMVISGGSTEATNIYNPTTNSFAAGPSLAGGQLVGAGAHSFQRSDGEWVVVPAGGSTNLQLYDPVTNGDGSFSALANGLNAGAAAGNGAFTFQIPDGRYIIVHGNSLGTSTMYSAGWNTSGTWTSEDISSANIATYSALLWSASPQSANNNARLDAETLRFWVKTGASPAGLSANPWVGIINSSGLIKAVANAAYAKLKIDFSTPVRSYPLNSTAYINQGNVWMGEGGMFYRRTFISPTVFSMRIKNPLISYGDISGEGDPAFGRNFATAGATLEGVITDNSNRLILQTVRNMPTATAAAGFIIASASANLGATAGEGTHTIERSTGKFMTLIGGTTTTRIYDPDTNTFSAGPSLPANHTVGPGAHSFLLPDGRFFTVLGNTNQNTAIFDTQANVFIPGPKLYGNVGLGANTFQRPDGFFIIVNAGNTRNTNILNPYVMEVTQGPFALANVTNGAMNIRRSDGRIFVLHGGVTTSSLYDPQTNAFRVGPPLTTGSTAAGSTAGQLPSGRIWVKTATTISQVYDPNLSAFVVGPTANATIVAGAIMIPAPDGRLFYGAGAAGVAATIIDPAYLVAASAGPQLPCTLAVGSNVFQRLTGEYVVICGGNANTFIIDAGWNLGGTYTSEQINKTLGATTGMYYKNLGQGNIMVKYRTAASQTALGMANWRMLPQSGTLINPTPGDSWFQTRIDLQGAMQDMPGAKTRVWLSENNGGVVAYYRAIQAPILQYWQLMNASDPTLLTLTSSNADVFRFASDGQAYTSDGGAWNSGGADLAERYQSKQQLEAGEVVVGDKLNSQNVMRSTDSYQTNIMGVVSTQPGFVAGSYTPNSFPIALVGRVPVKISTENGTIRSGDYLTSGSIPGYAMKATLAGRVLGTALEGFDETTAIDCPKAGNGNLPATKCGTITVFINLTSYNGQNVEMVMSEQGFTGGLSDQNAEENGLTGGDVGEPSFVKELPQNEQKILAFLNKLRQQGSYVGSEIFTNRVSAVSEVISPKIITDLLIAKKIKADSIEGLEILTNRISALENAPADATESAVLGSSSSSTDSAVMQQQLPSTLNLATINVEGFATMSGNLRVKGGTLIEGILSVVDSINAQSLIVSQLATFFSDVVFKGNVNFEGQPTFNKDTAGFAIIDKDKDFVEVKFNNEYQNIPIVTATIALNKDTDDQAQKSLEEDVLSGEYHYVITRKTGKGFIIRLNKKATGNMTFSWVAISIKDPVTTEGKTTFQDYLKSLDKTQPEASITPTPIKSGPTPVE